MAYSSAEKTLELLTSYSSLKKLLFIKPEYGIIVNRRLGRVCVMEKKLNESLDEAIARSKRVKEQLKNFTREMEKEQELERKAKIDKLIEAPPGQYLN